MVYLVKITARAERDLQILFDNIQAAHSAAALKWYVKLKRAILSLERQPRRSPAAPESNKLRHLLFGSRSNVYRVIYRILEESREVEVLHIRHGGRQRFGAGEVP